MSLPTEAFQTEHLWMEHNFTKYKCTSSLGGSNTHVLILVVTRLNVTIHRKIPFSFLKNTKYSLKVIFTFDFWPIDPKRQTISLLPIPFNQWKLKDLSGNHCFNCFYFSNSDLDIWTENQKKCIHFPIPSIFSK